MEAVQTGLPLSADCGMGWETTGEMLEPACGADLSVLCSVAVSAK